MQTQSPRDDPFVARFNGVFQVTWPAFLGAAAGVGILFSAVDPAELRVVEKYLAGSAAGAYTVGFFLLFGVMVLACSITYLLVKPSERGTQTSKTGKADPPDQAG